MEVIQCLLNLQTLYCFLFVSECNDRDLIQVEQWLSDKNHLINQFSLCFSINRYENYWQLHVGSLVTQHSEKSLLMQMNATTNGSEDIGGHVILQLL